MTDTGDIEQEVCPAISREFSLGRRPNNPQFCKSDYVPNASRLSGGERHDSQSRLSIGGPEG